jgi:type IV secretion system protein VirB5
MITSHEANRVLPPPVETKGTQRYLEQHSVLLVSNRQLRIALFGLTIACLALTFMSLRTLQTFRAFKPLVIRINDIGRAEAVAYDSLTYQPRDAEVKYFLIQFVTRHYGRIRATVRESYARSLYFLDGRLADALIEANKKSKLIETFLAGEGDEIEIEVKNVTIEDLRQPPYKATVDFEKIYYSSADHRETHREKYVASFIFVARDRVPNAWIPVNPLGLTISYFREDQAFQ